MSNLYQVYTDVDYVYAATISGLDIYDITSEEKYAYINNTNRFTTVWGNDDIVFIGTTASGIKYLNKTCISGSISAPYDLSQCLNNYTEYSLTSNGINYIHGNNSLLMCCTTSGIDVIKTGLQSYRSYTTTSGAKKCFMTSSGKFYYTTVSGNTWFLNRVNSCLWDWSMPDYYYSTNGDILEENITLNDIFVTENTSGDGYNTLFIATSSGVYIVNEQTDEYAIYYTTFLAGATNNFSAIWADVDASLDNGKIYVASSAAFSIIDLTQSKLVDWYTASHKGACNEVLNSDDIVDVNV